jgi:colanic acid biosynthesis glycosyl transferase WcaI
MNILFLADNFPPERNAQASLVYERACYWVKWGAQVTVLTCAPNFPEGKVYPGYRNRWHQVEEISGIRVVRLKTFIAANSGHMRRILDYLSFLVAAVVAGLFERRPDVIVATSPQFFAAVGGWMLASLRRLPFVMEVRDLWPDSIVAVGAMKRNIALKWIEKLELLLYRKAAAVIVLTPAFRENLLSRAVPAEKVHVILSGVDLDRYSPVPRNHSLAEQWGMQPGDFVLGYIGTLGMAHGLKNVLDAAELVSDPDILFLLVGTGQQREELVAEAQRRGISNVLFVPAQPKEWIRDFWGLCDVSLVHLRDTPLFQTVIPSKIFESMGMGLPILIAAPKGQASGIVENEQVGCWVPAESPQALATAATELKNDCNLRRRFAQNSLAAAPRYSREHASHSMLALLKMVCGKDSPLNPEATLHTLQALSRQLSPRSQTMAPPAPSTFDVTP